MKKLAVLLVLLVLAFDAYCVSLSLYLPSKASGKPILPVDSEIGQIADKSESESNSNLARMISSEFSFEWTETNFAPESAKALSAIYSVFLSEHLPASDFIMSKQFENSDSSTSISVRFSDGKVATFVIKDNKIYGMSI